ncbi:unnamed protein product [Rotaria sordida]|uniref:Uncharacterized protein n=1 Tax=Rotaria sordida TaxID=392033 RepID=A0A819MZF8_9BILA|nr:unnamed protein product [Rotaria sordida]CAF3989614.1 unnamed protein product [Rotaria sordida]
MNVNKSQQKHQQHTRKAQHFKKKHRRLPIQTKKVSDNHPIQLPYTLPSVQFKNLSVSQQSPMKKTSNLLDITTSTNPTLLLTDYLTISNIKFKEMLLASTSDDINKDALNELLNNEDIFLYIRQLTQLVNKLNYSKLQNEQWSYYYHLGNTEGIWNGRVSKNMADANSMCQTYGRSKMLIQQRQQKYKQQFEQNQNDINEHMKQAPALIDMTQIMNITNNLIYKDQYHLRIELQRPRLVNVLFNNI